MWGSGFEVKEGGFRVRGSGFRVQGSGFRVQGAGFRVQDPGFRVSGCTAATLQGGRRLLRFPWRTRPVFPARSRFREAALLIAALRRT